MAHCWRCDKECEWITVEIRPGEVETNSVTWEPYLYCETCLNNWIVENKVVYYKWVYYNKTHPDITTCDSCWNIVHRNIYAATGWYCNRCTLRRWVRYSSYDWQRVPNEYRYCPNCWAFHREWLCNWCLDDIKTRNDTCLRFTIRKDHKSRDPKGWAYNDNKYIQSIWQFQTERDLSQDTKQMLIDFYHHCKNFNHYYTREPIYIEWDVTYSNTKILTDIKYELENIRNTRQRNIKEWKKVSKYSNYYLKGLTDDWLIKWWFIDIMWNVRERAESINKFFEDVWLNKTNAQMTWEFKYVLSSDINHKIKAFELNKKVSSCQKEHNYDSFAKWAYDAITNGCNCPILLYSKWSDEPFARITTRIMYDKQWQEYILIDRIYHSWEFSDSLLKWTVYKWIVKDLKAKWYKVIASNYSAHDESTYSYLASLWMNSETVIQDLCQPLRRLIGWYGYYCDWGTMVRTWEIDDIVRATDYLDKAYLL